MTVSKTAGPIVLRELLSGLESPGLLDEWADIAEKFQALDIDQRVRLAVRVVSILQLSNTFHVGKRRL